MQCSTVKCSAVQCSAAHASFQTMLTVQCLLPSLRLEWWRPQPFVKLEGQVALARIYQRIYTKGIEQDI